MKYTTRICNKLIPKVLIEYLWKIVSKDNSSNYTFSLTARNLGIGNIQDILINNGSICTKKSFFGYAPVSATIQVLKHDNEYVMSLKSETYAA